MLRYEVARVDVVRPPTNASARRESGSRVRKLNPDIVIDTLYIIQHHQWSCLI